MEKSYKDITESLNVDKSTILRTVALFEETGDVHKKEMPPASCLNDQAYRSWKAHCTRSTVVISRPGIYLREVKS